MSGWRLILSRHLATIRSCLMILLLTNEELETSQGQLLTLSIIDSPLGSPQLARERDAKLLSIRSES